MKKIIQFLFIFYTSLGFGQIGIGLELEQPTATLDINKPLLLPDLKYSQDLNLYNKQVVADSVGNIALKQIDFNEQESDDLIYQEMNSFITISENDDKPLNISISVIVPAHSKRQINITYNIPVFAEKQNGNIYTQQATCNIYLTKETNRNASTTSNSSTIDLGITSRKFSLARNDNYIPNTTIIGLFLANIYPDIVNNTTATDWKITYSLRAYTTKSTGPTNFIIGNYTDIASSIEDWGNGILMARIYKL